MTSDILKRPVWMDDDFAKKCIRILKSLEKDSVIQIQHVSLSYVVAKGENFTSLMYRVNVKYHFGEYPKEFKNMLDDTFLIKVAETNEATVKYMFETEIVMYKEIVPKLTEILNENDINTTFICKFVHSSIEQSLPYFLVLEDLKGRGFVMADRLRGVDLEHSKLVLSKLAKFHAASMVYFDMQGDEFKIKHSKSIWTEMEITEEETKMFNMMMLKRIDGIIDELNLAQAHKYAKTVEFLEKLSATIGNGDGTILPFRIESNLNALNHADFWVNNMLFKYMENGSLDDVIFIDLQMSYYTSVGFDFFYFFLSSTSLDVKKTYFEELQIFYYDSLVHTLKKLNCDRKIPTFDDFQKELKRCVSVVTFLLTAMLPVVLAEHDERALSREESASVSTEEFFRMIGGQSQEVIYYRTVVAVVDLLQGRGYFDRFPAFLEERIESLRLADASGQFGVNEDGHKSGISVKD